MFCRMKTSMTQIDLLNDMLALLSIVKNEIDIGLGYVFFS